MTSDIRDLPLRVKPKHPDEWLHGYAEFRAGKNYSGSNVKCGPLSLPVFTKRDGVTREIDQTDGPIDRHEWVEPGVYLVHQFGAGVNRQFKVSDIYFHEIFEVISEDEVPETIKVKHINQGDTSELFSCDACEKQPVVEVHLPHRSWRESSDISFVFCAAHAAGLQINLGLELEKEKKS